MGFFTVLPSLFGFGKNTLEATKKLQYAAAHPGTAARVVSANVASIASGGGAKPFEIPYEHRNDTPTIGSVVATPFALFAGAATGAVASAAAATLPDGKVKTWITNHPFGATAAAAAVIVAPAAAGSAATHLLPHGSGGNDAAKPVVPAKPPASKPKRKSKPRSKVKKRKKPSRKRASARSKRPSRGSARGKRSSARKAKPRKR